MSGRVLMRDIVGWAAFETGVPASRILELRRGRGVVRARDAAIWGTRTLLGRSFPQIAAVFGTDHHTTILSAFRRAERRIESDPAFRLLTTRLAARFGAAA